MLFLLYQLAQFFCFFSLWNKTLTTCCPEESERCPFVHKYLKNDQCSKYVSLYRGSYISACCLCIIEFIKLNEEKK